MPVDIVKTDTGFKAIVVGDVERRISSEYAAWHDTVKLDEGEYHFEHFPNRSYWQWVATIPGTVTSSYWCSHFGGVPVGGNDRCINGNVGERRNYVLSVDDYLMPKGGEGVSSGR